MPSQPTLSPVQQLVQLLIPESKKDAKLREELMLQCQDILSRYILF